MNIALKEWAVVVSAMNRGLHRFLLRKGGLADSGQEFKLEHSKFLLFPTYEHQKSEMIADAYQDLFKETLKLQPPLSDLVIDSWAEVEEVHPLQGSAGLEELSSCHIWSDEYMKMRINYKPEKSLYRIDLKLHKLNTPKKLKNLPRYGGCRSWVELEEDIDVMGTQY